MTPAAKAPSARQEELLESAYRFAVEHGITDVSLRPLAAAIGSSPRVLLYLFGSKDGLIRALLARARADELALLARLASGPQGAPGLADTVEQTWHWLADPQHRGLLGLWLEAYARSVLDPGGPWAGFAASTVDDWLGLLRRAQPVARRDHPAGQAEATLALAVLRGALMDLLATGDTERTTAALQHQIRLLTAGPA